MIVAKNPIALPALVRRLLEVRQQAVVQSAIAALPKVKEEISLAFYLEKSPAQRPWAPLKPKKVFGKEIPVPNRQILRGIQQYFTVSLQGEGRISVRNSKWYTKFHFTGTKFMDDRRYLPFPGEKVPVWEYTVSGPIRAKIRALLGVR